LCFFLRSVAVAVVVGIERTGGGAVGTARPTVRATMVVVKSVTVAVLVCVATVLVRLLVAMVVGMVWMIREGQSNRVLSVSFALFQAGGKWAYHSPVRGRLRGGDSHGTGSRDTTDRGRDVCRRGHWKVS